MAIRAQAAQDFVPLQEVRNGIIVMKDGSLRAVLMASSLNFALKSEEEQQAIIMQFQHFLNSLEFSIQFYIQSKRLDIRPYLALLESRRKSQTSELMKIQTHEYMEFVKTFVEATNIMTKSFFVVVPYSPFVPDSMKKGVLSSLGFGGSDGAKKDKNKKEDVVEEHRTQMEQRISVVEQGLARCGVRVAQLGTEEVIELLYKIFNPGELEKPMTHQEQ